MPKNKLSFADRWLGALKAPPEVVEERLNRAKEIRARVSASARKRQEAATR